VSAKNKLMSIVVDTLLKIVSKYKRLSVQLHLYSDTSQKQNPCLDFETGISFFKIFRMDMSKR
ncbi:hypothetical protein, partial [Limosilactobacillus mucosae]|uniref:hypothetical protein n=1 Tax=Limosilactobacillus mucosae TaxID=97478 RepID=UPI0022DFC8C4